MRGADSLTRVFGTIRSRLISPLPFIQGPCRQRDAIIGANRLHSIYNLGHDAKPIDAGNLASRWFLVRLACGAPQIS
jgi:hypothetical protein